MNLPRRRVAGTETATPTSEFTIRRTDAEDLEAFRRIRLEALRAEPAAYASSYEDWVHLSDQEWRRRLQEPVFVAFANGEPVGIMGLSRYTASKMAHRAKLVMVYVRESLRGTGLAAKLLDGIIACAREEGILQLELTVNAESLDALRFYRREGFAEQGRIPAGFLHEGREIETVVMVRRVDGR